MFGEPLIMGVGFAIIQNPADHREEQKLPLKLTNNSLPIPFLGVCVFIEV